MTEKLPVVSVILSFRNEADVIPELIRRLQIALRSVPVDYELIFVNDASTDRSLEILKSLAQADRAIKVINMSRRFGVSECALAGMQYAQGDAVVYMDADLQDPPEVIPQLIAKWREGADVVHTVRSRREGESTLKLSLTDAAYHLIGLWADIPLVLEAGDFKLLSRRAVTELLKLEEKTPYLRGLVAWIGFNQVIISYKREARGGGITKFPLFRNIFHDLANLRGPIGTLVIGLTSFSLFPIMIFLILGFLIFAGSLIAFCVLLVLAILQLNPAWWLWLITVIGAFSGLQLLSTGTLGIYLGRVYQDVRGRPRYIVESVLGFES
jgi:dolichol-phosphate mannosyltransferase